LVKGGTETQRIPRHGGPRGVDIRHRKSKFHDMPFDRENIKKAATIAAKGVFVDT
jgi:hypothetical protein